MKPASVLASVAVVITGVSALDARQQVFRARIDMVAVYPLVSSAEGRLVTNLRRDDFTVLDNGKPVDIEIFSSEAQPITAALLLDMSASMEDRLARVRDAAARFVHVIGSDDRLRIGTFGSEIALSPYLTSDKKILSRVLDEELWPGGSTPLWNALGAAMQSLAAEPGRRIIVVVTDGLDTSSTTHTAVVERAIKDQFMIYAVGFEGKGLGARLVDLIGQTGGGHFDLRRSDNMGEALLRFAAELRHQYLIGFTPRSLDGQTHSLEVQVRGAGLTVRAPRQFVANIRK